MRPIVFKKANRPKPPVMEPEPRVFVCECGCEQSAPDDEAEAEQFARLCGWRKNADGTYTCPPCAGGDHLAALKAIFEGRGKERLS